MPLPFAMQMPGAVVILLIIINIASSKRVERPPAALGINFASRVNVANGGYHSNRRCSLFSSRFAKHPL